MGNLLAGLGTDEAGSRIAGWWRGALRAFPPEAIDVQVSYYADLLVKSTAQGPGGLDHLEADICADIVDWARLLGAFDGVAQGRLTQPARMGVEWVARRYGLDRGLITKFVATFFPEVHRYFADAPNRERVLEIVSAHIRDWRPRILIAHSLGSVVAYEALWRDPSLNVELLLTLGSPLALPKVVYDRLDKDAGARQRPPGVRRWVNIADRGDIIAIPAGGISQGFDDVAADISDSIHAFDFHRVTNYLACPTTTATLAATI